MKTEDSCENECENEFETFQQKFKRGKRRDNPQSSSSLQSHIDQPPSEKAESISPGHRLFTISLIENQLSLSFAPTLLEQKKNGRTLLHLLPSLHLSVQKDTMKWYPEPTPSWPGPLLAFISDGGRSHHAYARKAEI
ncbi:hypothetical protein CEXT_786011 [Caerostris extrusa]|uniref:Uncharacterized protein n=1 Tax=Caerostris extrusa TaxID=172846 RepID=A0AAV4VRY7_CAEEX|nr:hypothetical protein CEXT_786011 [Caerostris extrusa]